MRPESGLYGFRKKAICQIVYGCCGCVGNIILLNSVLCLTYCKRLGVLACMVRVEIALSAMVVQANYFLSAVPMAAVTAVNLMGLLVMASPS